MLLCKDCAYNNNCNIQEIEPNTVGCAGHGRLKEKLEKDRRLIDADALISDLKKWNSKGYETYFIGRIIDAVDEQPTAYDVDKVVAQLEAKAICGRLPVKLAVEIVKEEWNG